MMSSTDLSPYFKPLSHLGFIVVISSDPDTASFFCATERKVTFGVPILTGNRFRFTKEGNKFVLSHVCGHPTGDYHTREFDTFEDVVSFVLPMSPNYPSLDESFS